MSTLTIPSKTFLLGEYAVLEQGKAILASTHPNFIIEFSRADTQSSFGILPESPTQQFIDDHPSTFKHCHLEYLDPHISRGGFGSSSAQFLSAYAYHAQNTEQTIELPALLETFWHYHQHGERLPSGADIAAQWHGGILAYDRNAFTCQALRWPFEELDFVIIKTHLKIATHKHLETLPNQPFTDLHDLVIQGESALINHQSDQWVNTVNAYQTALHQLGLSHPDIQVPLASIQTLPGVLAVKGCGALGADVFYVVIQKHHQAKLQDYCQHQRYRIVAQSMHISPGLQRIR